MHTLYYLLSIYIFIYIYIYIYTSQSITTLDFTINSHLDYSDHISIMIQMPTIFYITLGNREIN